MLHRLCAVAALVVVACAVAGAAHAQTCTAPSGVCAERIAFGLSAPVYLAAPTGDTRLFVVERAGRIRILENGVVRSPAFLDITGPVNDDGEGGLLSLAFAPDYASSGAFYVYYTTFSESSPSNMRSVVSRFTVTGDPATATDADEASETPIFELDQPYQNHNGGTIAIRDGFLYLGLGDGGSGGDPEDRAQDDASPFGKMLRLDLGIADPATDDWSVWAKGLRNPFRFGFDRETGDLYVGDVGQGEQEEVDAVPASASPGLNFGWDVMEGNRCYEAGPPSEPPCNDPSLLDPIFVYDHPGEIPGAIAGGSVYRGSRSPSLRGWYFFADASRTLFFRLRWTAEDGVLESEELTGRIALDAGSFAQPVAIAEDGVGELYVVGLNGQIHRLVPEPGAVLVGIAAIAALRAVRGARRAT